MLDGDIGRLAGIVREIDRLGGGPARRRLAAAMSQATIELIHEEFAGGFDPDGNPWAPLKLRVGGMPLRDTGSLANSFHVSRLNEFGFAVTSSEQVKLHTHQFGATIVPVNARALAMRGKSLRLTGRGGRALKRPRLTAFTVFAKRAVIPARPMLPLGPLPAKWRAELQRAAADALAREFNRLGS